MGLEQGNLLVDTGPDLRHQLLREKIGLIHAVLYTHEHADHIFGMDDLRLFQFYLGHSVPIFCEARVEQRLRQSFDYAFTKREQTHRGSIPQLSMNEITTEPFQVLDTEVVPIRLHHGRVLRSWFSRWKYCIAQTPTRFPESLPLLEGLDCLILDALRGNHATHFGLDEAIAVAHQIAAKRTVFTHISHDLEHEQTNAGLQIRWNLVMTGCKSR